MNDIATIGLFGKLPAHGDFVHRNLPTEFINTWDEWLQHFVAGSQEQIGTDWLDVYLTSPIWRFVFSPGVIDSAAWAGILMPSVDRVGRYFPFSVVMQIPTGVNPLEFLANLSGWFEGVEEIALRALDGELVVDDLMQEVTNVNHELYPMYSRDANAGDGSALVVNMDFEEQASASVFPCLLDSYLSVSLSSYSLWTTKGSERVLPCVFTTRGLPPLGGIASMLDGQWAQRNWQQPYNLRQ